MHSRGESLLNITSQPQALKLNGIRIILYYNILVLQNVAHNENGPMSEMCLQQFSHQLSTNHSHYIPVRAHHKPNTLCKC